MPNAALEKSDSSVAGKSGGDQQDKEGANIAYEAPSQRSTGESAHQVRRATGSLATELFDRYGTRVDWVIPLIPSKNHLLSVL